MPSQPTTCATWHLTKDPVLAIVTVLDLLHQLRICMLQCASGFPSENSL